MKITVDLEEDTLNALMRLTGETKKGPAITKAASEYLRKARLRQFGLMVREGELAEAFDPDYHPDRFPSLAAEPQ